MFKTINFRGLLRRVDWDFVSKRIYVYGLIAFAVFLMMLVFMRYIETTLDGDVYFHIAYGREIVTHKSLLLDEDKFRWAGSHYSLYVAWIPQTIFYLLYKLGGDSLFFLYSFRIFLLFMLFLVFAIFFYELGIYPSFSFITMLATFYIMSRVGIMFKADMFTVLFFFSTMALYFAAKIFNKRFLLYWIPFIILLWTNSHVGVSLGYLTLYLLLVLEFLFNRSKGYYRHLLVVILLSTVAVFISPKPFYIWHFLQSNFVEAAVSKFFWGSDKLSEALKHIMAMKPMLVSLRNPQFFCLATASAVNIYLLFLWLFSGRSLSELNTPGFILKSIKKIPWELVFLNLFFLKTAIAFGRFAHFYASVSIFTYIYLARGQFLSLMPKKVSIYILEIFSIFAFLMILNMAKLNPYAPSTVGDGPWVPVMEMEFINKNIPGKHNMMNTYGIGSYVMLKGNGRFKVFIDTRAGSPFMDYMNFLKMRFDKMNIKPTEISEKADVALLNYRHWRLLKWFLDNKDWKVVFWGPVGVVLVKKDKFPALHWNTPKFSEFKERFFWPFYQDNLMLFLIYMEHFAEALVVLDMAKEVFPIWYENSKDFWRMIVRIEGRNSLEDVFEGYLENIKSIETAPRGHQIPVLYLARKHEKHLFDAGDYAGVIKWESVVGRYFKRLDASLYNRGLSYFLMNDITDARAFMKGFMDSKLEFRREDYRNIANAIINGNLPELNDLDLMDY